MLNLFKNYSDEEKMQKRINVKKITSLRDAVNQQIKNIIFNFNNFKDIYKLKKLSKKDGETNIKILLNQNDKVITFELKEKRFVNNMLLNSLNLSENIQKD